MKVNNEEWKDILEELGFTEQENCAFGGMVVFDDRAIPQWIYETEEEKRSLYLFLKGALYWKIHTELK